ncbi:hypothetical protein PtrSN002B_000770 [Pyrenophora tritici-repentis]|uniref:Uncharacterized protein n=1 Tax=Pyrenophora tritici-repentis TaxID=45151 RepID=A0A2W1EWD5_9PLEO|nr:hypothetical protein PtrV1_02897 [Pyrenophora tritici-repentis]KAF7455643.1 hypothetical protein A1F99_029010 [Pyrenophora tritici-repentis]KAF7578842.1 hypothetical protein PtrM4_030820 [Pyrenophora tritici-repentis]KAG9389390.1 hypothetical protein A1F94_002283 [Pyrenophora tritici-repentis]KAI0588811.1 hypothetical protein Alg215_00738 [Pyrenophora tritici-repentis]
MPTEHATDCALGAHNVLMPVTRPKVKQPNIAQVHPAVVYPTMHPAQFFDRSKQPEHAQNRAFYRKHHPEESRED